MISYSLKSNVFEFLNKLRPPTLNAAKASFDRYFCDTSVLKDAASCFKFDISPFADSTDC